MTVRPIRNDKDHKEALARVDELLATAPPAGTDDDRELEVLSVLIDAYEKTRWPIAAPSAVEAIEFRMEQMGATRKDLQALLGVASGRVSEILSSERGLSFQMMRALHDAWGIPYESLMNQPARMPAIAKATGRAKSGAARKKAARR